MALTYRFYRSPVIGTGTRQDPFRSALTPYIVEDGTGAGFWDWINPITDARYALSCAESTIHDTVDGDATITALSDQLADLVAVVNWLDSEAADFQPATPLGNVLEGDRISVAWMATQTTRRQLFRYISKTHTMGQDLKRLKNGVSIAGLGAALDLQVNQITAAQRNAIASWINSKGLSTAWVTNTTTLRQVRQYILENIEWPVLGWPQFTL